MPSSQTDKNSFSFSVLSTTSIRDACEYFAESAIDSDATKYAATSTGSGKRPRVITASWTGKGERSARAARKFLQLLDGLPETLRHARELVSKIAALLWELGRGGASGQRERDQPLLGSVV